MSRLNHHFNLMLNECITNIKKFKLVILLIAAYLLVFQLVDPHGPNCLIKRSIGIPCPGCGMTRSLYYLITLRFEQAFLYHPLVLFIPIIGMVLLLNGYGIFQTLFHSKVFWGFIIILFISTYLIRMVMYYPDIAPMDHYFNLN